MQTTTSSVSEAYNRKYARHKFNYRKTMMPSRFAVALINVGLAALSLLNGMAQTGSGQPTSAPGTLKVGDPAPLISVGEWIQGDPVNKCEEGKAYLLDFWATWCSGCVEAIPHLNVINESFKERGLIVIGQCVSKMDREKIAPFVKKMGKQMAYRVVLDNYRESERGAMAKGWCDAARQEGIPVVFLVGKDGKIAWIGHPMGLILNESIIKGVLNGTFDGIKVHAGPMGQTKRLAIGDPALALHVSKWLKGQPVRSLETGKAYLLEFWATWCPDCITSIPRLNAIQRKFKDKDLVVLGIEVCEGMAIHGGQMMNSAESIAGKMECRVAMDDVAGSKTGYGTMMETWLFQAYIDAIPTVFLVGKDGRIKFIGDPSELSDAVIESVIQ